MTDRLRGLPAEWASLDWQPTGVGAGLLSWQGASHESWRALGPDGSSVIAKAPRPHAKASSAAAARIAASDCGVGPTVVASDVANGVTVERELSGEWRVATGLRVQTTPNAVAAIAAARRVFRRSTVQLPARDLGAEAQRALEEMDAAGAALPLALTPVASALPRLREALSDGPAAVPSWLSSELSDVQLGPDGAVLLTGGTTAGLADPLADVGALLTELSPTALPAVDAFALLWGDDHPGAFARARLWGVIADLWVILRAMQAHALEPASEVGYLGYLMFRMWHAEHPVITGEIDDLVRAAAGGWR
jgi:hypothetical protein